MVACVYLNDSSNRGLVDTDIIELLKEANSFGGNYVIHQRTEPRHKLLSINTFRKKQKYIHSFQVYAELHQGIEYQSLSCASGSKNKTMAYLYGFINGANMLRTGNEFKDMMIDQLAKIRTGESYK